MTDPFLLDQAEVDQFLQRLEDAMQQWRQLQANCFVQEPLDVGDTDGGGDCDRDNLRQQSELADLEGMIRNGIRDVKWSLEDLESTLKLMQQHSDQFSESEDLNSRQSFLEFARRQLADIEFELLSPPIQQGQQQQQQQRQQQRQQQQHDGDDDDDVIFDSSATDPMLVKPVVDVRSMNWTDKVRFTASQDGRESSVSKRESFVTIDVNRFDSPSVQPNSRSVRMRRCISKYRIVIGSVVTIALFIMLLLLKMTNGSAKVKDNLPVTTPCPIDDFSCI